MRIAPQPLGGGVESGLVRLLTGALLVLALAPTARARGGESAPLRTRVIALVDSRGQEWERPIEDPVHEVVEMPLNYLGLVVLRHDIRKGPPPDAWLDEARAVLTYFDHVETAPGWLGPWLAKRAGDPHLRFVHLGEPGPLVRTEDGEHDPSRFAEWLSRFGLGYDDFHMDGPLGIDVTYRARELSAYEADARGYAVHRGPWNLSKKNLPWVSTACRRDRGRIRTPVVTGPWGGIALDPWLVSLGTDHGDRRWHVDPFAFFRAALGLEGFPAPHPSVLNGRRMFICHVDGDGFESRSTVRHGEYCGQVFLEEIAKKYELPFTVSVVVASLTEDFEVREPTKRMKIAAEILARPNVEPASHGVLHPSFWGSVPEERVTPSSRRPAYRSLENYEFSLPAEIRESARFINERLLTGRRSRLMLWTGGATPTGELVEEAAKAHGLNMNGGIYRWDAASDSVGYVPPFGRVLGSAVQVYPGASNENIYEGFFTTMPSAFRHVSTTIERTGDGRILKPADIYIHFYSAERPARLASLHRLLRRWGIEEPTAPVFASTYAAAVRSALTTARIRRTADGFAFRGFGGCRTVRIDGEKREVDWGRSRGLIGANRIHGSLFLHLAAPDAEVVLADDPERRPHVLDANHLLEEAALLERSVAFVSVAVCRREVVLAGFPPNADLVLLLDEEESRVRSGDRGRVRLLLERPGRTRVEVRIP